MATSAKESAIVSRARLRRQRGAIERWTAFIGLFISFLGTIAALAGGWTTLIAAPRLSPILIGIAVQAGLTYLQWHYYDTRLLSRPSRVIDAVFTALGYGPLFQAALMAAVTARGVPEPWYVAWAIIGLIAYGLAWYPESRLVE